MCFSQCFVYGSVFLVHVVLLQMLYGLFSYVSTLYYNNGHSIVTLPSALVLPSCLHSPSLPSILPPPSPPPPPPYLSFIPSFTSPLPSPPPPCLPKVLEVAWASRIIQPGVDGRKEKERIANVTGMSYSKVHEWFRNRRKKEKLVVLRKKGLAPAPSKKWSPLTRQQSGSSSSSDLSSRLESANLETGGQGAVSATAGEMPPVN